MPIQHSVGHLGETRTCKQQLRHNAATPGRATFRHITQCHDGDRLIMRHLTVWKKFKSAKRKVVF